MEKRTSKRRLSRKKNYRFTVNYIHTWSDFREANPEFGEDQFDEVIGRIQVMF
jgi:hypothetical protein